MKQLSVIVPCYNVEGYLERCLDSLVHQNIDADAYEVLLIDDGSTDSTGAICDRYAAQYPQVQAIHQANAGQGAARNAGLDLAQGKYVWFVDSDDFVAENCFQQLLTISESNDLDVLFFDFLKVAEGDSVNQNVDFRELNAEVTTPDGFFSCLPCVPVGYVWQNLIKRSLIEMGGVRFAVDHLCEDTPFMYQVFFSASRISKIDNVCYFYTKRSNSTVHGFNQKTRLIDGLFICVKSSQKIVDFNRCSLSQNNYLRLCSHFNYFLYLAIFVALTNRSADSFCLQLEKEGFLPLGRVDKSEVSSWRFDVIWLLSKCPKLLYFILKISQLIKDWHNKSVLD